MPKSNFLFQESQANTCSMQIEYFVYLLLNHLRKTEMSFEINVIISDVLNKKKVKRISFEKIIVEIFTHSFF